MEKTIKKMIEYADKTHDYNVAEFVADLLNNLSVTSNTPSNWRYLAEELAEEYNGNDWIMDNCRLYDYI